MTEQNFSPSARNLTHRERVLTIIGPKCGQCGYEDSMDPLVVRVPGVTQNRKSTNYSQYWLTVLGQVVSGDRDGIEVICRNCMAIEQAGTRPTKKIKPTVYVYGTNLLEGADLGRQQWLDVLEEPKTIYILANDGVSEYRGNTSQGSKHSITKVDKGIKELIGIEADRFGNRLYKVVDGNLEVVV